MNKYLNKIIQGDCLDVMKNISDKSIDMILCDLPYGTTACKWDVIISFEPLWEQYKRVIKDNGMIVLTSMQPFTSLLVSSCLKLFKYSLVWNKGTTANFLAAKKMFLLSHEDICIFSKGGVNNGSKIETTYNPIMTHRKKERISSNNTSLKNAKNPKYVNLYRKKITASKLLYKYPKSIINISGANQINKIHPTQKPVKLFEYLIKTYSNENDTVLDNCSGSGTTAIACMNLNRNYICIEKEQKHVDLSIERVNNHKIKIDSRNNLKKFCE